MSADRDDFPRMSLVSPIGRSKLDPNLQSALLIRRLRPLAYFSELSDCLRALWDIRLQMTHRHLDQRLKLTVLRAVDAVEAHRSLLKASVVLGVTQPALTKTLQELEDIIQIRLFDRHSRGVRPTEAGLAFIQMARRILAELRRFDDDLDQLLHRGGGTVVLGALPVTAAGILPGVLVRMKAAHPDINIRVQQGRTEDLLPLLASGEIDMIVGRLYAPAAPDRLEREPLWTEPISILARTDHPIFAEPVTVDALQRYELVLPTVSQRVAQEIEYVLTLLGLQPTTSLRSSSYGFIREMLHATDLISAMPRLMMVGDLLRGTLRVVTLPVPAPDRPAGLIFSRDRSIPAAGRVFMDVLRVHVDAIAIAGVANIINDQICD